LRLVSLTGILFDDTRRDQKRALVLFNFALFLGQHGDIHAGLFVGLSVVSATTAIRSRRSVGHFRSGGPAIRVVETTKNRECGDFGSGTHRSLPVRPWFGDTLLDALVWPRMIEVLDVFVQDAPQVGLAHEQEVVQTLTAQAADQALADRIRARRADRRPERGDPASRRDRIAARTVLRSIVA